MAITQVQEVQYPVVATVEFTYADADSGVTDAVIQVPAGATVVGGELIVDTAWDSGTSDTIDIGDDADPDRYTATAPVDLQATGRTALELDGYQYTETNTIDVIVTSAGTAATAGSARVQVTYVVEGRGHEVQG